MDWIHYMLIAEYVLYSDSRIYRKPSLKTEFSGPQRINRRSTAFTSGQPPVVPQAKGKHQ